jgi:peptidoglycan/xylan/chitin deacetylase (PgdA/CDA1 family)
VRGEHCLSLTIFAVAMALQRHREATAAFLELGHEIACHDLRWINYQLDLDAPGTQR